MITFLPQAPEEDWQTMTPRELKDYIQRLEAQMVALDDLEPEDMESQAFEDWADRHEALEDTLDDIQDWLDALLGR